MVDDVAQVDAITVAAEFGSGIIFGIITLQKGIEGVAESKGNPVFLEIRDLGFQEIYNLYVGKLIVYLVG